MSKEASKPPTIRILLYTDDPNGITDGEVAFGLGLMIRHLLAHKPFFADVVVEWISRISSQTGKAENRLDALLTNSSKSYDEVWFFGTYQTSRTKFISGIVRGGPGSELGKPEVEVLREWMSAGKEKHMKGGGVLMTGDHNQRLVPGASLPDENPLCPETGGGSAEFLGLGRAIGRCVPRAGRLRQWEGKPTNDPKDSFNTQVPNGGFSIESQILQLDEFPQELLLINFDAMGNPSESGLPHPLFFYPGGRRIQVFPDHMHEGAIVLPTEEELKNFKEWPRGKPVQPRPRVVARGVDKRNSSVHDLVAAYNGDSAGVGRIVADSTWHHYIGVNLTSFPHPSPPGSPADQIGQFYGNLAIWLAPRRKRFEMACAMFKYIATHKVMMEEIGGDPLNIGIVAYTTLTQVASPCEISELLDASVPDYFREKFETIYLPESELVLSLFPSKIRVLGCIVNSFHQELIKEANSTEKFERRTDEELIAAGFNDALVSHVARLNRIASEASELVPETSPIDQTKNRRKVDTQWHSAQTVIGP